MSLAPAAVPATMALEALVAHLTAGNDDTVPVLDDAGALVGILSLADLEQHALSAERDGVTAADLTHDAPVLRSTDTLEAASRALAVGEDAGLPVLDADGRHVAGWVTHRDVLRAYHQERERLTPSDERPAAALAAA